MLFAMDNTLPQSAQKFIKDREYSNADDALAFKAFVNHYLTSRNKVCIIPVDDKGDTPGFTELWYKDADLIKGGSLRESNIAPSLIQIWNDNFFKSLTRVPAKWKDWLTFQFTPDIVKQFETRGVNNWEKLLARRSDVIRRWAESNADRESIVQLFDDIAIGGWHELRRAAEMPVGIYALSLALDWYVRGQVYGMVLSEKGSQVAVALHPLRWPPTVQERKDIGLLGGQQLDFMPDYNMLWGDILGKGFRDGIIRFDVNEMCGKLEEARQIRIKYMSDGSNVPASDTLSIDYSVLLSLGVPAERASGLVSDILNILPNSREPIRNFADKLAESEWYSWIGIAILSVDAILDGAVPTATRVQVGTQKLLLKGAELTPYTSRMFRRMYLLPDGLGGKHS